jgi:hypothetical protein
MFGNLIEKARRKFLFHVASRYSRDTSEAELAGFLQQLHPVETTRSLLRVGGRGDGGYLIPDDLDGIVRCFSPGVATISNFEIDLASRGIPCSLADYSIDHPTLSHALITFDKKFIGVETCGKFMTLADWVSRDAPGAGDLLLQMDIEKYEYPVVLSTPSEVLRRFRIVAIEFHLLQAMTKRNTFAYIRSVFEKLLPDFHVVHIHPNNGCAAVCCGSIPIPPVMEFTFLRKDRAQPTGMARDFPHALDARNVDSLPELPLPAAWHHGAARTSAPSQTPAVSGRSTS